MCKFTTLVRGEEARMRKCTEGPMRKFTVLGRCQEAPMCKFTNFQDGSVAYAGPLSIGFYNVFGMCGFFRNEQDPRRRRKKT